MCFKKKKKSKMYTINLQILIYKSGLHYTCERHCGFAPSKNKKFQNNPFDYYILLKIRLPCSLLYHFFGLAIGMSDGE